MGTIICLRNTILLACVLFSWITSFCDACILTCQCTPRRQKGRTVDCGNLADPISSLADLKFPPDTVHLDLSFNALAILKKGWFIQLSSLQRLNLSNNDISVLEPGAFDGLQSLKKLDLSHNQIEEINSHMFSGLPKLQKLILSFNLITAIPEGTFNDLTSLKKFEFRSVYLWCDCRLKWILKWAKVRRVKIPSSTVCSLPPNMKGKPLAKLKRKELVCEPLHFPIFNIRPSKSQLVFRGDKLPFECHASVMPGHMEINWFHSGHLVESDKAKGVFVHTAYSQGKTIINHRLVVESLDASHGGDWSCVVSTPSGNRTKTVQVQVSLNSLVKCPPATNRTSKGVYVWKESAAGIVAVQRCQAAGSEGAMATQHCGLDGYWYNLNMSKCSYLREVTRRLAQLAQADSETLDIPTHLYGIEKALILASQKPEVEALDSLDVFYMADIMKSTLLPHAIDNRQIAGFLVNLTSAMTELPDKVIRNSQLESVAASRMTMVLSRMLQEMDVSKPSLEWDYRAKHIAVTLRNQQQISRQGLSCTLKKPKGKWSNRRNSNDDTFEPEPYGLSSNLDFTCDQEELDEDETSLVSVFIPPERKKPAGKGAKGSNDSKDKSLGKDVTTSAAHPTTSSSLRPEVDTDPSISVTSSSPFFPPATDWPDIVEVNSTANDDHENTTTTIFSSQSHPQPLDEDSDSVASAESKTPQTQPDPPRRLTRSANRFNPPKGAKDFSGPPKGFPSFPPSADQLRDLNISTRLLSNPPATLNLSTPSLSKLPASLGKSILPYLKLSGNPLSNSKAFSLIPNRGRHAQGQNFFVVIYRTGKLFPILQSEAGDPAFETGTWAVVTPVVVISLGNKRRLNLTTPIAITFEVEDTRRPLKASYFNYQGINGYGGWYVDGCEIVHRNGSMVTVQVHHLSAFAIVQEVSYIYRLASFSMEPIIYVGSGLCALCMLVIINTYICCFSSIGVPKKIKHAVVNLCLSSFLMVVVFALGINRTSMELPCQMVGISLHYLTLCALFWITITSNITYKKFVKADRPPEPPPELGPMPLPPKPILQFYFVGYGVPIIICGITAAVNLQFYAGIKYCFLEWEPSLGAFYAPVAILVAWNLVLFMRISCVVRNSTEAENEAGNESEDNEIHNNEIELVPSQPDTNTSTTGRHSMNARHSNQISNSLSHQRYSHAGNDSCSEEDAVSQISLPDQERRPITQLRALVAIHFLFIVMWTCGALAIAKPFHLIIPYQELIFSYLYGLMSSLFGIFMLVYFLLTRTDSKLSWKRQFGCAPPETYTAPMEVTETQLESPSPLPTPQTTLPVANGSAVKSNSNTNLSVYSQKSSNITKAYNMKNNTNTNKQSNINLILANSSDLSHGSTGQQDNYPNFFNPRQNGAAKKFWQKNRHHSKIMNKDINRDLNSSLTDNNSGTELNQPRLSNGTSSDANTHLSIEIQIQPKHQTAPKLGSFCGSREIPVHISNSHNNMTASCGAISLEHNNTNNMNRVDANNDRQGGGLEHNDLSSSAARDKNVNSTTDSNPSLPHHQRSPSSGGSSLNMSQHRTSAFTPVQPRASSGGNHGNPNQSSGEGDVDTNGGEPSQQEDQSQKEPSPARNQLSGPEPHSGVPKERQMVNGDLTRRPPNPGVKWNPFPITLPPMPSHHPNNKNNYSFTPPPQYHQVIQQPQHYGFDFAQYPPMAFNMTQGQPPVGGGGGGGGVPHGVTQVSTAVPPPPPHPATTFNIPPSPYLVQNHTAHTKTPKSQSPVSSSSQSQSHHNHNHHHHNNNNNINNNNNTNNSRHHRRNVSNTWRPLSGGDSSDSSRSRPRQSRSGGSPGRTMVAAAPPPRSPVGTDSHASEPMPHIPPANNNNLLAASQKKARSVDGDHHSDPTHHKKHHRLDKHHRNNNKLTNKQRSLGWDEHLKTRTPKINYVYVNHLYRDKVMHKLIKQASESDDLASKAFWLPRSTSEYERLTQKGFCSMADDTSSSSEEDDSLDNIWIPQRSSFDFQKKETSV